MSEPPYAPQEQPFAPRSEDPSRRPRAERSLMLIDNYDSFTHNLAHAFAVLGLRVEIVQNDRIDPAGVLQRSPDYVVLSPGPGAPRQAGVSLELARALAGVVPLLGVCLGHQCIGEAFGAVAERAAEPVHGKTSAILHTGQGLFDGLPRGFHAARYHSLVVPRAPPEFEVLAWTRRGEIMALGHVRLPLWGVQFHPESFLTEHGSQLLENFLELGARRSRLGREGSA